MKFNYEKIIQEPYNFGKSLSIEELVRLLKELSYYYYNESKPKVSDDVYDMLIQVLREKDNKHSFLEQVGYDVNEQLKVKLPYNMMSLEKIKTSKELDKFKRKYKGPYVISDKLDGMSALLIKKNNKMKLYKRGNGKEGYEISNIIKQNIFDKYKGIPEGYALRGELIISYENFKKIRDKGYTVARSAVSGLVNSKNYPKRIAKITDFVTYELVNPRYDKLKQMKEIEKLKVPMVNYKIIKNLDKNFLSEHLDKRRKESKYEIDGIVVIDSSKNYSVPSTNPEFGFAFKKIMKDQIAETVVQDIIWNISKNGYLNPRIKIEPVIIGNTKINYVTAFNAKYVVDNILGSGAIVEIIRSGDVIPYIYKIKKISNSGKPKMPDIPYKWTKSYVDIIVEDMHGEASSNIKIRKIQHFMNTLEVKNISEGIIKKFVDNDIDSIYKILNTKPSELYNIEGLGNKIIDKIYKNLYDALNNAKLHEFMAASGIFGRGFGRRRIKMILQKYPVILDKKWSENELKEKINKISGFDDITSSQFSKNMKDFKKYFEKINKVYSIQHIKKNNPFKNKNKNKNKTKNIFDNQKIVFTGFRKDKDIQQFIENNGGTITSAVSGSTNLVIYKDKDSSKYKKAIEKNIKLISYDDFKNKYNL